MPTTTDPTLVGPPVTPEVIGRLQGIQANPVVDPIALLNSLGLGFKALPTLASQVTQDTATNLSGSPLLGAAIGMATQNPSSLRPVQKPTADADPWLTLGRTVRDAVGGRQNNMAKDLGGAATYAGRVQDLYPDASYLQILGRLLGIGR